jgi:uncharacterized protein (UPF0335 family)
MNPSDSNKLKQYMEKIENLETELAELKDQMSDVFGQAKNDGFEPKIMKKILKLKKMRTEDRRTEDFLTDSYMLALGMIPDDDAA